MEEKKNMQLIARMEYWIEITISIFSFSIFLICIDYEIKSIDNVIRLFSIARRGKKKLVRP